MELDLKYKQYVIDEILSENKVNNSFRAHQEEIDMLENFAHFYPYHNAIKLLPTIKSDTDLTLQDGTKAHFIIRNKIIQMALELPNGDTFACIWTNTTSKKELLENL